MSLASFGQKQLDKIAKASAERMGDILIFTSVAGWIASSAAQIFGIATNKNYTKEQKKFMLSQEAADAMINIGSFFAITKSLTKLSSKLVSTAKIAPKQVVNFLKSKNLLSSRGKFDFNVTEVPGFRNVRPIYNGFKCFADSAAAVTGGIISSNIVTPLLRNEYASHRQNDYLSKTAKPEYKPAISTPRHTFDDFKTTSMHI